MLVKSREQLVQILSERNIDFTNSPKGIEDLWNEIESGESSLMILNDGSLRRITHVILVKVFSPDGEKILTEVEQSYKNGIVRNRNIQSIAEKMVLGEEPLDTAERGLKEELGINPELCSIKPILHNNNLPTPSSAYTGIESIYVVHNFHVIVPESQYKPSYIEEDSKKITTFKLV